MLPLVAVIALLMGLVAYAAFPAFRASVLNLLMKDSERYTTWEYQESDEFTSEEDALSFKVELPDDYYLVRSEKNDYSEFALYQSKSDSNATLEISLQFDDILSLKTDNEDTDYYEKLIIQGHPAILIEKDDYTSLIMSDTSVPYFILINSNTIGRDELCRIAENLKVLC